MADTTETNADAESSRVAEVLSSVPQPNRAERRKMAALGEAVPVTITPPKPDEPQDEPQGAPTPVVPASQDATSPDHTGTPEVGIVPGPSDSSSVDVPENRPAAVTPRRAAAPRKTAAVTKSAAKPVMKASEADLAAEPVGPAAALDAPSSEAPAAAEQPSFASITSTIPLFSIKDMTMDMNTNFSGFQTAMTDAQAKAKAAFEKSSSVMGEVGEFTKGNVEACIESGKIFAEGCQEMGSTLVAESRTAFETMTGDIKELAAAKSPTDFLKIQSDMVRKNFDSAVAYSSKNSEAFLKLMSDVAAPLSGRMSLAVEKVRQNSATVAAA